MPPPSSPSSFGAVVVILMILLLLGTSELSKSPPSLQLRAPLAARSGRRRVGVGLGVGLGGAGGDGGAARRLDLQVVILSQAANARKRAAVRLASLSTLDAEAYSASYYFSLTRPASPGELEQLAAENETHGDLRFSPEGVQDVDLARKVWLEVRAAAAANASRFWIKLDDDHMVFYDRLFENLSLMPQSRLLWGRRGSGAISEFDATLYTNNAYLMSADVLQAVAADPSAATCFKLPGDDYCIGRSATTAGSAELVDDPRWHNDDDGDPSLCLCRRWTLEDETSIVVHHVKPQVMEAFATNKTRFAEMRFPDRNYARR